MSIIRLASIKTSVYGPPPVSDVMGKYSVEGGEDSPAAGSAASRAVVATVCIVLTCAILVVTIKWESQSEMGSSQAIKNLYELQDSIVELKVKLRKYNSSIKGVHVTLDEIKERLDELSMKMNQSLVSLDALKDTMIGFKISLVKLKEVFERYRYGLTEMKEQQDKMKGGLDKLPGPVTRRITDDFALLENTIYDLRYSVIPTLRTSNIMIFESVFEEFGKKNCTSNIRNGEVSSDEWANRLVSYSDKVDSLKNFLSSHPWILQPSVEKILVSNAKEEDYRLRIDEVRSLFTLLHSNLNAIKENIDEFNKKWDLMIECKNEYIILGSEPDEGKPKVGGNKFDVIKLFLTLVKIGGDLPEIEKDINEFNNHIFEIENQMDIARDSDDPEEDDVSFQENARVPEGSSLVGLQEPIGEWSGVYEQEPTLVQTIDGSHEETDPSIGQHANKTGGANLDTVQTQNEMGEPENSRDKWPLSTDSESEPEELGKVGEPEGDSIDTTISMDYIDYTYGSVEKNDTFEGSSETEELSSDGQNDGFHDLRNSESADSAENVEDKTFPIDVSTDSSRKNNDGSEDGSSSKSKDQEPGEKVVSDIDESGDESFYDVAVDNFMVEQNGEEHSSGEHRQPKEMFILEPVSWAEAKKRCQDMSAQLAVIASAKQQEEIASSIRTQGVALQSFWISKGRSAEDYLTLFSGTDTNSDESSDTWFQKYNDPELCPFLDDGSIEEGLCSDKKSFICERIDSY